MIKSCFNFILLIAIIIVLSLSCNMSPNDNDTDNNNDDNTGLMPTPPTGDELPTTTPNGIMGDEPENYKNIAKDMPIFTYNSYYLL